MADNDNERTQEATPHRRQQAREEGQIPKSQDLASAALLLLGLATLLGLGGGLIEVLGKYFARQIGGDAWLSTDPQFFIVEWQFAVGLLAKYVLPIFALVMLAGIAANFFQVGFLFLPEKLAMDITRLDPLQGLGRLFSLQSIVRLVMGLLKMIVVATVAYASVKGERDKILSLTALSVPQIAMYLGNVLLWTGIKIAFALLTLAVLDYGFQRWKHERDLRMSSQEIREEMKNLEGNPQVIAKRKQVQRQLAMQRLTSAVPKADLVVTNPTELAIAIQYDSDKMAAPVVVAKGAGSIAAQIRRIALQHGIPIIERKPLAQALYREVEIDQPIPRDKYAAVAELLAYVYQLKGKKAPQPRN